MNYTQEDLMQKLAKYEELRIKNETKGLTSMVKSACKRMSYDCKSLEMFKFQFTLEILYGNLISSPFCFLCRYATFDKAPWRVSPEAQFAFAIERYCEPALDE